MTGRVARRWSWPWSRIRPRLVLAVMLPVVALGALGGSGAMQRYREADALSGIDAQVDRVSPVGLLYHGLIAESGVSQTLLRAEEVGLSPTQVSDLLGLDMGERLRSARSMVDAAVTAGAGPVLGDTLALLASVRTQIDTGSATSAGVRAVLDDAIDRARSAWSARLDTLTNLVHRSTASDGVERAANGLVEMADVVVAVESEIEAASALTAPGAQADQGAPARLAAARAVSESASSAVESDLGASGREAWDRLIVNDPNVQTFQQFVTTLVNQLPSTPAGMTTEATAPIFRSGLIFEDHLREVVTVVASDVVSTVHQQEVAADREFWSYLRALGLVTAGSVAAGAAVAHTIVRPLRRLAVQAAEVSAGNLSTEPLPPGGPTEVESVAAALGEVVASLRALDAAALALARGDLDDPRLVASVPGRIGDSIRASVELLARSVRENDELRQSLQASEARFRELADNSGDIIWRLSTEPEPHFEYLSPSFELLTGIPVAEVEANLGKLSAALSPADAVRLADVLVGARPLPQLFDLDLRRSDGSIAVLEIRAVCSATVLQGVGRDVTEVRALQEQLQDWAGRDPLTGLANRRLLDELLERAVLRTARSGERLAVAFLDLDGFKDVNDRYGHDAGDAVLRVTAARLESCLRDADVVARYGGDEFVVVLEGFADDVLHTLPDRIAEALVDPIDIGGSVTARLTMSVGIAHTGDVERKAASLLAAADQAMFAVKRSRHDPAAAASPAAGGDRPLPPPELPSDLSQLLFG